jgi:hypothetical protein
MIMAAPANPDRRGGEASEPAIPAEGGGLLAAIGRTSVLYPNAYVWFVFVSSMDVMLTWKILERDGTEINPIARAWIDQWGLPGAIIFKFSIMISVIGICEFVGRTGRSMRWLAVLAVVISSLPVLYSLALLAWHTWVPLAR